MKGFFDLIMSLIEGFDIRRRWLAALGLVILLAYIALRIESITHIILFNNLSNRIELLSQLSVIADQGIENKPGLYIIYKQLTSELSSVTTPDLTINFPRPPLESSIQFWKAISSAIIWIVFIPIAALSKFPSLKERLKIIGAITILAVIAGLIGWFVPVIITPWINYLVLPILQIILLVKYASK